MMASAANICFLLFEMWLNATLTTAPTSIDPTAIMMTFNIPNFIVVTDGVEPTTFDAAKSTAPSCKLISHDDPLKPSVQKHLPLWQRPLLLHLMDKRLRLLFSWHNRNPRVLRHTRICPGYRHHALRWRSIGGRALLFSSTIVSFEAFITVTFSVHTNAVIITVAFTCYLFSTLRASKAWITEAFAIFTYTSATTSIRATCQCFFAPLTSKSGLAVAP